MHLIRAQLLNSLIAQKLMIIAQKAYDYNQTYYPAYDSAECEFAIFQIIFAASKYKFDISLI